MADQDATTSEYEVVQEPFGWRACSTYRLDQNLLRLPPLVRLIQFRLKLEAFRQCHFELPGEFLPFGARGFPPRSSGRTRGRGGRLGQPRVAQGLRRAQTAVMELLEAPSDEGSEPGHVHRDALKRRGHRARDAP